jgi:hypothetical protein
MCANLKQMGRWITIAVAMGLVCASHVSAQKPIKPPPPPSANLVNLGPGSPRAMNQLDSFVEIVGSDGSGWGRYWMVCSTGTLVDSFDLETLPGAIRLEPFDINNQGQIVGFQEGSDGAYVPLVWASPQSLPMELPLPENSIGMATSISDDGIVVGPALDQETGFYSLMAWKIAVSGTDIEVLDAQAIISSTAVIFEVSTANNGYVSYMEGSYAFRLVLAWDGFQLSEVEGSRTQLFAGYAEPSRVNDHGTVCGRYMASTGRLAAYAKTVAGDLLVLPTLPGGKERGKTYVVENSGGTAINNKNQLVGRAAKFFPSTNTSTDKYDVILNVGGQAINLESVVSDWQDYSAMDINDAGWVIGKTSSGAVVLIP